MNEGDGPDNRIPSSPGDAETLRYRTWPCASCGGDFTPISYLVRCQGADPSFWAASGEVKIATEIQWLRRWVESCPHNRNELRAAELTEGSEHRVYLDEEFHRIAIKAHCPAFLGIDTRYKMVAFGSTPARHTNIWFAFNCGRSFLDLLRVRSVFLKPGRSYQYKILSPEICLRRKK